MYSNKENANMLTALLVAHNIKRVVVCPGSRNAVLVNDFQEHPALQCYAVTDERSAGFYALGLSLADNVPVAVCVTSGTALLNLAPAVAEASYRHHGLIVISADRPQAWIEQLDGQTLQQVNALAPFVERSIQLPEPTDAIERWHCNRLINEALLSVRQRGRKSVHINVPISEPLFDFSRPSLSQVRKITQYEKVINETAFINNIGRPLLEAQRPMLIIGQLNIHDNAIDSCLSQLSKRMLVVCEPTASDYAVPFDVALSLIAEQDACMYWPDFVLYLGDTLTSKCMKKFIRKCVEIKPETEVWHVSEDGQIHDTFQGQTGSVEGDAQEALSLLAEWVNNSAMADDTDAFNLLTQSSKVFVDCWHNLFHLAENKIDAMDLPFSQAYVVKAFEQSLEDMDYCYQVHYANSSAIRLANIFSNHYIWANRGVNGIEGSLSTAAGFSIAKEDTVFCVIGDLSFFYDQNALWNSNLEGNLRILLLNNGCGGIFYNLAGLEKSSACKQYVAAAHQANAKGICEQNDIGYIAAYNEEDFAIGLATFLTEKTKRPMVYEVFTDVENDAETIKKITCLTNVR